MIGYYLLAALGGALLTALVYEWDDDDDNDGSEAVEIDTSDESSDTEPRQTLSFTGDPVLDGTEGDDTLPGGQDPDRAPGMINLLGGDDTAVVEYPFDITVDGGEGDDELSSTAVANTLVGGEGNDTLSGIDANTMDGGAGDDEITFTHYAELNSSVALIGGGDGDDLIRVEGTAGQDQPDAGGARIEGGSGSDQFEVVLDLVNSDIDLANDDGILESTLARIADFNPEEDTLLIQIDRTQETEDREVEVGFEQTETEDGSYTTELTLTFAATPTASQAVSTMYIESATAFTLDDIELVGVSLPASS